MKEKVLTALAALSFSAFQALDAQNLQTATWQSFGVSFQAPEGFQVEEDSEESYSVSTPTYYITVQLLEGEDIPLKELAKELKHMADEDGLKQISPVKNVELPQFKGVSLTGSSEEGQCLYGYLTPKDGEGSFYVSIIYNQAEDTVPEKILNSFLLAE